MFNSRLMKEVAPYITSITPDQLNQELTKAFNDISARGLRFDWNAINLDQAFTWASTPQAREDPHGRFWTKLHDESVKNKRAIQNM